MESSIQNPAYRLTIFFLFAIAFGNEIARMISLAFDNETVLTDDGGHR